MIIAWSIDKSNNATTRLDTFKSALKFAKDKFINPTDLIVDSGSENNNTIVENYLYNIKDIIKKLVAQKDIKESNSAIEAINKILKNNYLNNMIIENGEQLVKILQKIIYDYNIIRPHGSLNGLTPSEKYNGLNTTDVLPLLNTVLSRFERIKVNKSNCCIDIE